VIPRGLQLAALLASLALCACTARYSQTLVGTIEKAKSRPVANSSEGWGLSAQSPGIDWTLGQEEPAEALLSPSCEAVLAQIDTRSVWVFVPLGAAAFYYVQPRVSTVTFCTVE